MKNLINGFKTVDKKSIIGIVVVNVGLLVAMFGANQDGVNAVKASAEEYLEEQKGQEV